MTPLAPRSAALGLIICFGAMTWACGPRSAPAGVPASPEAAQPPGAATPPASTPKPPLPSAAATPPRTDTDASDCELIAAPGEHLTTVALADPVDPSKAPYPSNDSERLLFRQLYETLVRVDCHGRVGPGLAASWRLDADGRSWIVTLRDDARFSDGTPVTATAVRAAWTTDGSGDQLRPHVSRLVQSIVPIDGRSVAITLRSQRTDAPLTLGHTDLAIAKPAAGSRWPLGTRPALSRDNLPSVRFVAAPRDPRDLLDEGVDLLLTRDPATVEYAATLPQFQSVPMEWQRTHVLLTPGRSRTAPPLADEARQRLAGDAVRGEARGATGPFWWQRLQDCDLAFSVEPPNASPPSPRIVYDAADGAARDLAERFVGLVRASGPAAILDALLPDRPRRTYQRAAGLSAEALVQARRRGTDAGYIISLDRRPLDPCREIQVVRDGARWLDPETIVPLVDTRLRAIVRRGRSGLTAEWDGGIVIAGSSPR